MGTTLENNRSTWKANRLFLLFPVLLAALLVFVYTLPFGMYVYKGQAYGITGLSYLSGKVVAGGKTTLAGQPILGLGYVSAGLLLLSLVFTFKNKLKVSGLISMISGFVAATPSVVFLYNFNTTMSELKKTEPMYGTYCLIAVAMAILVLGFCELYRCKAVNLLDVMVIPGTVYLIVNNYLPMSGIIIAFKNLNYSVGVFNSPWNGLDNFKFLFQNSDIWQIIRNTLCYNFAFIILNNVFGVAVGIMLSEVASKKLRSVSQTTILLPQIISWVIVSYMVYGLLATNTGWINKTLLPLLGYDGPNIAFYGTRKYWPFILTFVAVWKGLGYNSIIYLSSIVSIDSNLYEAALIDGCGKLKQIRYITLPLLRPTIITLVIMALGHIMNSNFGLFYQITQNSGALYPVTQTLDVFVYRSIMETQNLSMGAAAAAVQSIVGFCLVMLANAIIRKKDASSALF